VEDLITQTEAAADSSQGGELESAVTSVGERIAGIGGQLEVGMAVLEIQEELGARGDLIEGADIYEGIVAIQPASDVIGGVGGVLITVAGLAISDGKGGSAAWLPEDRSVVASIVEAGPYVDLIVPALPCVVGVGADLDEELVEEKRHITVQKVIPGTFPAGLEIVDVAGRFGQGKDDLVLERKIGIDLGTGGQGIVGDRVGLVIDVGVVAKVGEDQTRLYAEGTDFPGSVREGEKQGVAAPGVGSNGGG
jgi:hypothetical protein